MFIIWFQTSFSKKKSSSIKYFYKTKSISFIAHKNAPLRINIINEIEILTTDQNELDVNIVTVPFRAIIDWVAIAHAPLSINQTERSDRTRPPRFEHIPTNSEIQTNYPRFVKFFKIDKAFVKINRTVIERAFRAHSIKFGSNRALVVSLPLSDKFQ